MEEYKPNSHKSKEEQQTAPPEKKVEKVVSGSVKSRKKSEIQKFANVFVQGMLLLIPDVRNLRMCLSRRMRRK